MLVCGFVFKALLQSPLGPQHSIVQQRNLRPSDSKPNRGCDSERSTRQQGASVHERAPHKATSKQRKLHQAHCLDERSQRADEVNGRPMKFGAPPAAIVQRQQLVAVAAQSVSARRGGRTRAMRCTR